VIWDVKEKVDGDSPYITFYYHSFDGEQGRLVFNYLFIYVVVASFYVSCYIGDAFYSLSSSLGTYF
jgi:hypothetical protein